jgi:hypothetical protein
MKVRKKFDIKNTSIHKPFKIIYRKDSIKPSDYLINPRYDIQINLMLDNTYNFAEAIGFRYCINKHGKTYLAGKYLEMKEKTRIQRIKILDRSNELIDKNIGNVFSRKNGNMNFNECVHVKKREFVNYIFDKFPTFDLIERIKGPIGCPFYFFQKKI